jgi:hypothetical protein
MSYDVPQAPISCNDLRAIVAIVTAYLAYLRNRKPPLLKRERTLRLLQGIQQRLTAHVAAPQQLEETSIPLTAQEIHALEDAMGGFVQLVRQVIPSSNQRDDLLQQIEDLREHLQMAFTSYQS